jgi:carbon storage regulator CsrA
MLVLSRRFNEKICIPMIQTTVQVVAIKPGSVRLGIEAPPDVVVLREEIQDRMTHGTPDARQAKASGLGQVGQFLGKRLDISQRGLAVLRRQLQAGNLAEAELTLDSLEEDLGLLRQRLEKAPPEKGKSQPEAVRKARALLVEDNANERELLATFLRISGLDVVTAGDGCDALDYLHSHHLPDLVLLDMGLPRCDGPTVVREIRRDPKYTGLKIFAVSGHVPEEFDLTEGPAGVNRWFHKPIDPTVLVRNVNEELDCLIRPI